MSTKTKTAISLFIGFTFFYLFTSSIDSVYICDSRVMLEISKRILEHGFQPIPGSSNEETFSQYGIGQSLLNLPFTWAYLRASHSVGIAQIYYTLALLFLAAMIGAATNVLLFSVCMRFGYQIFTSVIVSMILGLTTINWVFTQTLFSDPTLGFLLLLVFHGLISYQKTGKYSWLIVAGCAAGYSLLTKIVAIYPTLIFTFFLLNVILKKIKQRKPVWTQKNIIFIVIRMFCILVPILVCLCTVLWFNHVRYNNYFYSGYQIQRFKFDTPLLTGIYGLLFSSGKGIFFFNPSLLLALFSFPLFYRKHKPETVLILFIGIGLIIIYAKWWAWHGDWSWGPRLLVPVIPFFILFSAPLIEKVIFCLKSREPFAWLKLFLIISLLLISFLIQIPGLCIDSSHFILVVANETGFFEHPFYSADEWPIRDDALHIRFIPEFNPIAGHIWMMRCVFYKNDRAKLTEVFKSPPWKGLNPKWIPKDFVAQHFYFSIWWLFAIQYEIEHLSLILMTAGLFFITGICALTAAIWFAYIDLIRISHH